MFSQLFDDLLAHGQGKSLDAFSGEIEKVLFHNSETGYCVLKVRIKEKKNQLFHLIGSLPNVNEGEWVTAEGYWENSKDHGWQFKADQMKLHPPTSLTGIEKYLGSGMIKGIGTVYAKKLVKKFGANIFHIIEYESQKLEEVDGIGKERRKRIKQAWIDQKMIRDIMLFLHTHGVGITRSTRIYKIYGSDAIHKIRANPYRLVHDIHGIGFHSADKVAKNLGIANDSLLRARAGMEFILQQSTQQGHCALPKNKLIDLTVQLLDISSHTAENAYNNLIDENCIKYETVNGESLIFLPDFLVAEKSIAEIIELLLSKPLPEYSIISEQAIPWVEKKLDIQLSRTQCQALSVALKYRLIIITGGPGVGKTTLIKSALKIFMAKKWRVRLTAPTGRAAQRLTETTGIMGMTIHRLLEFQVATGGFLRNKHYPIDGDVLVVDEMSMVDLPLMSRLLNAVNPNMRVLLVGDADQLPSVGPGNILSDLIHSKKIPVVHLKEIFRQSNKSAIIDVSHAINQGNISSIILQQKYLEKNNSDFSFYPRDDVSSSLSLLVSLVKEYFPLQFNAHPIDDIQILTPMRRGTLGGSEINKHLQATLNPPEPNKQEIIMFGILFREGDKVMQICNNYEKEVFNGDIGKIVFLNHQDRIAIIRYNNRDIIYDYNELDDIELAYAITIHKSQGSEFPIVILPINMQHYILLQRNLLYTAVTRGKKMVAIIGQKKAFQIAVQNSSVSYRYGLLKQRLSNII